MERFFYTKASPDTYKAMLALSQAVGNTGLSPKLIDLVNYRVSQLNGCAYCLDMHTKDARVAGESEQRLYVLSAWREAPFYSERERAALAWTEAITRISDGAIDDALYGRAHQHFDDKEIVDLTLAVIAINAWNRLAIPFRTPAGSYQPRASVQV
jgi:AhpD family alkylhydroperoxidase